MIYVNHFETAPMQKPTGLLQWMGSNPWEKDKKVGVQVFWNAYNLLAEMEGFDYNREMTSF